MFMNEISFFVKIFIFLYSKMENENEEIRLVGKRFLCHNCYTKFTKLVKPNEVSVNCKICL